jgi:DNA-binding MarR family transcriptional regulator
MKSTIRLDGYVLDTLMRDLVGHDHRPSAFLLYLCLWNHSSGGRSRRARLSLSELAGESGLSKRAVQQALAHLVNRKLVRAERDHRTAVPEYELLRPWRRRR